ncbi:MAG: peptidylprolyl isomerase [Flavobacterium sp.]|nr:peptidylprolyl isomerase [Flavobacterium sp.]
MAILAKIRRRSILLISIIALSLFAFVAQDLFRKGDFSQSSKDVGSVNGENILFQTFNEKVNNLEKSRQGTSNIQAVNQVWDQEVSLALVNAEIKKLGIRAGEKQIVEGLKNNQNIGGNKQFQDEKGVFSLAKLQEYFKSNPGNDEMYKNAQTEAAGNAKIQIYFAMLKGGFNTTKADGKAKYEMETNKVSFDFVALPFSSIKDDKVKVSDDELITFMKTNEKKYKAEETREINYVLLEDKASATDEAEVKNEVNALLVGKQGDSLGGFNTTNKVVDFVNEYSDTPYDSTYVAKKDLPAAVADQLYNLPEGQTFGPYMNGKMYSVSKSMGKKSGVAAKASHILISYEGTQVPNKKEKRTKEQAKAKADALFAQISANPSSFMMSAFTASDDSSSQQGGDLGYFKQGQMVKPFNDFVFKNPVGKIGLVETDFGFHIINITDKQDGVRLATLSRKISASEKTTNDLYTQATTFEMKANDKTFDAAAKELKLTVPPVVKFKILDENVGALGNQRQIVRWAFSKDAKVGAIKRFELANVGQVIATVNKVNPKGLLSIEDAKIQVLPIVRNKKKAEMIKAKMKGSLEAIAKANAAGVQVAADLTMQNATLPNAGQEYKVVGTAFSTPVNKTSVPIEGNAGMYVVRTKSVVKAPTLTDLTPFVAKVKQQNVNAANGVMAALKSDADIDDNRGLFNY